GGFIDIAQNAKRLVFTGTFTTGGLELTFSEEHGLNIVREGKVKKFVQQAEHVTYRLQDGVGRGQEALLITERAIFSVTPEGLVLEEIAPGIDLEKDVLGQMEFAPVQIREPLTIMDAELFRDAPRA
ncbi:MAG: acyl CoA:acetate/3-ketoacid CoA transferase, partial [Marinobacter sp.]